MDDMLERLRIRLPDMPLPEEALKEYLNTVSDRLCLRLGVETLPSLFQSICIDATVKVYRRTYHEGISTEGVANISTSFVDDILAEYAQEIGDWKSSQAASGNSNKVVRFL